MAICKVVFISLPMSGRKDEDILKDLGEIRKAYLDKKPEKELVAFCHNLNPDIRAEDNGAMEGKEGVWYLGRALEMISKCDVVCFCGDWRNARGCQIEYEVCRKYNIPYMEDPRE